MFQFWMHQKGMFCFKDSPIVGVLDNAFASKNLKMFGLDKFRTINNHSKNGAKKASFLSILKKLDSVRRSFQKRAADKNRIFRFLNGIATDIKRQLILHITKSMCIAVLLRKFFFHYSQLHIERLLEKSQNPREIRTCSLPIARHKC